METSNLLKKLKQEVICKENMIDKKVIANFLITYFDNNTLYKVKMQILETLASALNLNETERKKVGLITITS
jgi:hypothetical protein